MSLHRNTTQKNRREVEKPERVTTVRAATNTSTMAAAAAVSPDKPLTEKQRLYALARARGESVPNAMAAAGYNEQVSYGYRMDKMPNIQRVIQQEQALYAEAAQIDRKKVIDMQLEAYEMAKTMAEPATMVAAAREIGKICGLYEPKKVEVSVNGSIQHEMHRLGSMSDAELLEFLARGHPTPHPAQENPATALPTPSLEP